MAEQLTLHGTREWVRGFAERVIDHADELTALDAAVGDADHGTNMSSVSTALLDALDDPRSDIGGVLRQVGLTIVSRVGGASGPLYGTFFLRLGAACGNAIAMDASAVAAALRSAVDGVATRGKCALGDKTMLDALNPAVEALEAAVAAGTRLPDALAAAAQAAARGRDATVGMVAAKGRASRLGRDSIGHADPGATSAALLLDAAAAAVRS
jgi:dihydroxyacetone kinase-like protein